MIFTSPATFRFSSSNINIMHRPGNLVTTVKRIGRVMQVTFNFPKAMSLRKELILRSKEGYDTQPILNRVYSAYIVLNDKYNSYSFDDNPSTAEFLSFLKIARDQMDHLHTTLLKLKENHTPSHRERIFYHLL